jgi:2-polyprenyl-3-methyl-5-hydroxy-6-metoxy-1,4-benzoquinol methylase
MRRLPLLPHVIMIPSRAPRSSPALRPSFAASFAPDPDVADPKEPSGSLSGWSRAAGSFIDYGCGGGALLVEAAKLKWRATGVSSTLRWPVPLKTARAHRSWIGFTWSRRRVGGRGSSR